MTTDVSRTVGRAPIILSIALLFFAIPHTLEDFAVGEPAEAGVPVVVLSVVVAAVFATQAVGLYWLGQGKRRGYVVHVAVGLFWPIASGVAQLPAVLGEGVYREGFISVLYVVGVMVVGIALAVAAAAGWRTTVGTSAPNARR